MEIVSLADRPDLVDAVARLRWVEWGDEQSLDDWAAVARLEAGRDTLPITLVAVSAPDGGVLGCLALGPADDAMTESERDGRMPWLMGMVTSRGHRGTGIGRALLTAAEALAARHGFAETWVLTGGEPVGFYEACGWRRVQELVPARDRDETTVLHKRIARRS